MNDICKKICDCLRAAIKYFYISNKYYLTLDGYFFCAKEKKYYAVFHVRNKRTPEIISVRHLIKDKAYLSQLHPFDGYILGILTNKERNEVFDFEHASLKNMQKLKNFKFRDKMEPLMEIVKIESNHNGTKNIIIRVIVLNLSFSISLDDISKKYPFIYSLPTLDAISLGYEVNESILLENRNYGKLTFN